MGPFEQKTVLDSFEILVDTREQRTARAKERYESFSAPWKRVTLAYGDYTYNAILPDGRRIHDTEETIKPKCIIERKMDLDELAACLGRNRKRFEKEFQKAIDNDARIFLLVEDASWEGLLLHRYRSKMNPNAFFASLVAWVIRYNINIIFCKAGTSGRMIKEILYRDLKARVERGDYDRT